MKTQKIILGSDHAGFELKEEIKKLLRELGYSYEDVGTYSNEPCDYPKNAFIVAKKVAKSKNLGILMCGTGLGEAIVANKLKGIRATNCFSEETAKLAKEHNNSNILCLGARILTREKAQKITKIWLNTKFTSEGRHKRRVRQIAEIEKNICK